MIKTISALLVSAVAVFVVASDARDIVIGQSYEVHSDVLDEDRTVLVHLPESYQASSNKYPVLYLLDGDVHFQHTIGTLQFLASQNQSLEVIVVAIANTDRTRDMTPTHSTIDFEGNDSDTMPTSGGADNFMKFMKQELVPHVEMTYRTQPFRILAGHSFGGLLALYAMFTTPDMFNAYIAVSPSVWWDGDLMVRKAEAYLRKPSANRLLYMTLANEGQAMRVNFDRIVELINKADPKDFVFGSKIMEEENHGSVVLRSHYQALRLFFDGLELTPEVANAGLEAVSAHYAKFSGRLGFSIPVPEGTVNQLGYNLLFRQEYEKAVAAFEHNIKHYPESANVYDSLGEAYERQQMMEKAAQYYEKAFVQAQKINDANEQLFKMNMERAKASLHSESSESSPK